MRNTIEPNTNSWTTSFWLSIDKINEIDQQIEEIKNLSPKNFNKYLKKVCKKDFLDNFLQSIYNTVAPSLDVHNIKKEFWAIIKFIHGLKNHLGEYNLGRVFYYIYRGKNIEEVLEHAYENYIYIKKIWNKHLCF